MMGGDDSADPPLRRPMRQRVVADAPRLGLEPGRAVRHGDGEDRMGAIKAGANLPHIKRLVAAFGAKAMIDGRGLGATGKGGVGEEQQGAAVGTAGHGAAGAVRRDPGDRFAYTSDTG